MQYVCVCMGGVSGIPISAFLTVLPSRVYGGSDELSDDITQQQLLPGVK